MDEAAHKPEERVGKHPQSDEADGVANTHATTHATKRMKTQKQAMQSQSSRGGIDSDKAHKAWFDMSSGRQDLRLGRAESRKSHRVE